MAERSLSEHSERYDMLAVAEHFEEMRDAERRAKVCPVCTVPYEAEKGDRTIRVITAPDDSDSYPCPGCRPNDYVERARNYYCDSEWEIERMLRKAARDVAAGRRL